MFWIVWAFANSALAMFNAKYTTDFLQVANTCLSFFWAVVGAIGAWQKARHD